MLLLCKLLLQLESRTTEEIDKFIDGAAVQKVGMLPFALCKNQLSDLITVPEGQVCAAILNLYNKDGIVAEPAGALAMCTREVPRPEKRG